MPQPKFLIVESVLKRLLYGKDASIELHAVIEELAHPKVMSRQIVNFNQSSKKIDELKFKSARSRSYSTRSNKNYMILRRSWRC